MEERQFSTQAKRFIENRKARTFGHANAFIAREVERMRTSRERRGSGS
jgi:hypothetical protein